MELYPRRGNLEPLSTIFLSSCRVLDGYGPGVGQQDSLSSYQAVYLTITASVV
jgi:hypothetical protein